MKRILIVGAFAVGGLVLAGAVSLVAFAVTGRQLSETPEPIAVGRAVALNPSAADVGDPSRDPAQGGQGTWSPSWTSPPSPSESGDDHASGDDDEGDGDRDDEGDDEGDDSSGPGSGDDDSDDSSGPGSDDDGPDDD